MWGEYFLAPLEFVLYFLAPLPSICFISILMKEKQESGAAALSLQNVGGIFVVSDVLYLW